MLNFVYLFRQYQALKFPAYISDYFKPTPAKSAHLIKKNLLITIQCIPSCPSKVIKSGIVPNNLKTLPQTLTIMILKKYFKKLKNSILPMRPKPRPVVHSRAFKGIGLFVFGGSKRLCSNPQNKWSDWVSNDARPQKIGMEKRKLFPDPLVTCNICIFSVNQSKMKAWDLNVSCPNPGRSKKKRMLCGLAALFITNSSQPVNLLMRMCTATNW